MTPHKIWNEQCEAAKGIEAEFGTDKALDYLIGEKFIKFLERRSKHLRNREQRTAKQCGEGLKSKMGRPVEPDSLRQSGAWLGFRCTSDEKTRWNKRAKKEGKPLAEITRSMLNEWAGS